MRLTRTRRWARADFAQVPVDGGVDGFDELTGDGAEGVVAEDLDGGVVGFQGVVEGELFV